MNPLRVLQNSQSLDLGDYEARVRERLKSWKEQKFIQRLWEKDPTLWFPEIQPEIKNRLGWLVLPEMMHEKLDDFVDFAESVKDEGITHVILLGMGGSSLAPEIFQKTFGNAPGYPELIVLDSTHPSAIDSVDEKLDLNRTLFLVSSKSGTTLETLSLFRYFWSKMNIVTQKPGNHFVAITDPDTPLMKLGKERTFRRIFEAAPDVGGRYSALTDFGLVPGALIGLDIHRLLDRAQVASENSAFCFSEEEISGLMLGASLGELSSDRDKLTFLTSSSLESFPDWGEQLIAESTGKEGKGILPVAQEPLVDAKLYGPDRFFIYLFLETDENKDLEEHMNKLKDAGHPIVRISLEDKFDLGKEIFRWEVAVASAGTVLGIHPFNQPDVQLAKDMTREIMEERGKEKGDEGAEEALTSENMELLSEALKEWIDQARPADYITIQAYLNPTPETTEALQNIRLKLLKKTGIATTLGYGPRFLHSTGQLQKGGPNNGLFLQLFDEPYRDLSIPEADFSFATLIRAQALGDYRALIQRGRRVLRVNLKSDALEGLKQLENLVSL